MYDLDNVIRQRRAIRMFLPDRPVPRELIDEALDLAIRAPSNSNIQPWHVVFVSGAARDRLVAALLDAAQAGPPKVPELPEHFAHPETASWNKNGNETRPAVPRSALRLSFVLEWRGSRPGGR